MNIKNTSRDEIKSQLIEGLKHSRKILKRKRGKTHRDLLFTVCDKQFFLSTWGDCTDAIFLSDEETRNQKLDAYLDSEIKVSRYGSKGLNLYMCGDMSRYFVHRRDGIDLPKDWGGQFMMKDLDVLISDDMSDWQKQYWSNAESNNFKRLKQKTQYNPETYRHDVIEEWEVDYKDEAIEQSRHYIDKLVDGLIKYLDDDYLSVCEKTNEVFVEMFKAEGLASIDDSPYLNDEGKKVFSQQFVESIRWSINREDYMGDYYLTDLGKDEDGNYIEGRVYDGFRYESTFFAQFFSYGVLDKLHLLIGEGGKDIEARAWKLAQEDVESLKEVA